MLIICVVHIRGTYDGRLFDERDVTFDYGEGIIKIYIKTCILEHYTNAYKILNWHALILV